METCNMSMPVNRNKTMSIILLSTCAPFIALLFLHDSKISGIASYNVHEILDAFIDIGIYLIPIEALIWVAFWINYHIKKDAAAKLNAGLNLLSFASLLLCAFVFTFFINGMTSCGCYMDVSKYKDNNGYYVKFGKMQLQISENDYSKIVSGKNYMIEYQYNKFIPNRREVKRITEIN